MKKIMSWLTGDIFTGVSNVIDKVVTTDKERMALKNAIYSELMQASLKADELKADIIATEAKGNFLQRSWRPIIMLAFGIVVLFHFFIYPVVYAFNPELPELPVLEKDFWDLLQIGIGGYVIGRAAEKIIPSINTKKEK